MSFVREHIVKRYQSAMPIKALGGTRSNSWNRVRKEHIRDYEPICIACGSKKKLQVHHISDFSTTPELELDHNNLATLCMAGCKCHLSFGHLGYWKSINPTVIRDSAWFRVKIENRR